MNTPNTNYVYVEKAMLEDTRLSWDAKGVMSYILGHPNFQVLDLMNQSSDRRDSILCFLSELTNYGYLKSTPKKKWVVNVDSLPPSN